MKCRTPYEQRICRGNDHVDFNFFRKKKNDRDLLPFVSTSNYLPIVQIEKIERCLPLTIELRKRFLTLDKSRRSLYI